MNLENVLETIKHRTDILSFDEAKIKTFAIERIFRGLDWEIDGVDEVIVEYSVDGGKIDYNLRINKISAVFVEAKRPAKELEKHERQVLDYSFAEGVNISILTNGVLWWFYLPFQKGAWEQRKFFTIDILAQTTDEAATHFKKFLHRDKISDGTAYDAAVSVFESRARKTSIKHTLPIAWARIVGAKDSRLIEALKDVTESLCGYTPDDKEIDSFLAGVTVPSPDREGASNRIKSKQSRRSITGKKVADEKKKEFIETILKRYFEDGFQKVGRFTYMFQSEGRIVYIQNCTTQKLNIWFRINAKPWRIMRESNKEAIIVLTNPREKVAYCIPVRDIEIEVEKARWERDYLEVNIDPISHRWRSFGWNIKQYLMIVR